MLFTSHSPRITRSLIVAISAVAMSVAAPAASQASVTHHHHLKAVHSDPYTRAVHAPAAVEVIG